jgi:hypothetical protein
VFATWAISVRAKRTEVGRETAPILMMAKLQTMGRDVGHPHHDAVALADAQLLQPVGDAVHRRLELLVGDPLVLEVDRRLVAVLRGRLVEEDLGGVELLRDVLELFERVDPLGPQLRRRQVAVRYLRHRFPLPVYWIAVTSRAGSGALPRSR